MLEKPDISQEAILSRLQEAYDVRLAELAFLPLGADTGTAVYGAVAQDGTAYFLKLRKAFDDIIVTVPLFLKAQGVQEIIVPIATKSKGYWADFGEYKIILYPFIDGKDGFETELSDHHRRSLGTALKQIHTAHLPPELDKQIPREAFSPYWRESLRSFQAQVENSFYQDATAARLAQFMKSRRATIDRLIERTRQLASQVQSGPLELVLCHTDIHGGNILIGSGDRLYVVDWDNPLLAPKERDLMFVGGGIDRIWKSEREEAIFYEGYGETEINLPALAYYRNERIVQDLAAFCEQLLLTDKGGTDREQAYRWFASNFEPGGTLEIAERTGRSL